MKTWPWLESRWGAAPRDLRPAVCCYCSRSLLCIFTAQSQFPESRPGFLHVGWDQTELIFFPSYLSSRSYCLLVFCFSFFVYVGFFGLCFFLFEGVIGIVLICLFVLVFFYCDCFFLFFFCPLFISARISSPTF